MDPSNYTYKVMDQSNYTCLCNGTKSESMNAIQRKALFVFYFRFCGVVVVFVHLEELMKLINYNGTYLIRHTKGPGKCVGLHRVSEYSGLIC